MARLPMPPDSRALAALLRPQDVKEVPVSTRLVRLYTAGGEHPQQWNGFRYTGPLAHGRFDTHPVSITGQPAASLAHGVLYFGLSARTSVAEVFQQSSVVDRKSRYPHLVVFRPTRPLRLLDLAGLWPTRAGASQEISAGPKIDHAGVGASDPRGAPRPRRALVSVLNGLRQPGDLPVGPAVGLVVPAAPDVLLPLDHPGLDLPLARICEELNYTLL